MAIQMETIEKLPAKKGVIGPREIDKAIKAGKVKTVIVAKNCPQKLIDRFTGVEMKRFSGDQGNLGTRLGKPFPVAVVGYE